MKRSYKILIIGASIIGISFALMGLAQYTLIAQMEKEEIERTISATLSPNESYTKLFTLKGKNEFGIDVWSKTKDKQILSEISIEDEKGLLVWNSTFSGPQPTSFYHIKPEGSYRVTIINLGSESETYSAVINEIDPTSNKALSSAEYIFKYYPVSGYLQVTGFFLMASGIVVLIVGGVIFFKEKYRMVK